MARVRYVGFSEEPAAEVFARLAPYRDELVRQAGHCALFSEEWRLIQDAQAALDRAAARITGDPGFYARKAEGEG